MSASITPSDAELLRLMLAGDEDAFTALYRRRQAGIYRFALQMSGSATVAEDVVQEVFLALMREGHRFDASRASLAAYLYGIARNQVLRVFERERPTVAIGDGEDGESNDYHEALTTNEDPLGDLTNAEAVEQLRQAVLALPAHYREVVVLCELNEMSYADAAAALQCAIGTVRSRLHRARSMLVEKMRGRSSKKSCDESTENDVAGAALKTARCFA